MNIVKLNRYPGGVAHCLTMSYDDGVPEDARLLDIFNKNGIKGSFHLNSGNIFSRYPEETLAKVYAGHEISCHMASHPFPVDQPDMAVLLEIQQDRRILERAAGIEYSRTTRATNGYMLPEDFLEWHPTCHHNGGILEKFGDFIQNDRWGRAKLFYVWGHSYEFPRDNNWDMIEEFCKTAGGRDNIWYATNIEIVDYVNAQKALRFSADCDKVYNPSAVDVWFTVNGETVCCKAGTGISF